MSFRARNFEARVWLWLLLPVFAAWVNLHGGFLAGLAVLGLWVLFEGGKLIRGPVPCKGARLADIAMIVIPVAAILPALLLNPYGSGLIRFLLATATVGRPEITEWAGLSLLSIPGLAYLVLILASAWGWLRSRRQRELSLFVVHLATAIAPSLAVRHLPLFALATIILAGEHIADAADAAGTRVLLAQRPASWLTILMIGMALFMVLLSSRAFRGIRIDSHEFAFPARAVAILKRSGLEGRLLVEFDWGEYVIWYLGPRIQVSIDGRRETVYSPQTLRLDGDFREGRPGWQDILCRGKPTLALLRRGTVADKEMQNVPGWAIAYEDRLCLLLARDDGSAMELLSETSSPATPPCTSEAWFPASYGR
jgi:hypothetical protein